MESVAWGDKRIEKEILSSKMPVLVEFYSKWCHPCQVMEPIVENVRTEFANKAKVFAFDIENNRALANKFAVLSVPTSIIFRDGKRVKTMTGIRDKQELVTLLN